MEKLPQELIDMICPKLYAEHEASTAERVEAMRQLRLVNSRFSDPAARELFQNISVELEPERISEFIELCNSPVAIHVHNLRFCIPSKPRQSKNNHSHQSWLEQHRDLEPALAKLVNIKCITVDCNPQPGSCEWIWVDMHVKQLVAQISRGIWPRLEQLVIASVDFLVHLEATLLDDSVANNEGLRTAMAKISTLKIAQDWIVTRLQQDEGSLEVISEYMPRVRSLQIGGFQMDDEEFQCMSLGDTVWGGKLVTLQLDECALESASLLSLTSSYANSLQVIALRCFNLWEDSTFCELFDHLTTACPGLKAILLDRVVYDVAPVEIKKLAFDSTIHGDTFAIEMTAEDAKSFLKFLAATECRVISRDSRELLQKNVVLAARQLFDLKDRVKDGKYEVTETQTRWPEEAVIEEKAAVLESVVSTLSVAKLPPETSPEFMYM